MATHYFTRIEAFFPADNSHQTFITDITDTVEYHGGMTYRLEEDLCENAACRFMSENPGVEFLGSCVDMKVDGKVVDWR